MAPAASRNAGSWSSRNVPSRITPGSGGVNGGGPACGGPGELGLDHAEGGSGGDAPLSVVRLIRAHGKHEERQSGGERGGDRSIPTMAHDHAGTLEDPRLWQIAADPDIASDLTKSFTRDPMPECDDYVERLVRERIGDQSEERHVAVKDGAESHIDEGSPAELVEPFGQLPRLRRRAPAGC